MKTFDGKVKSMVWIEITVFLIIVGVIATYIKEQNQKA
jgi:hypothetical protein